MGARVGRERRACGRAGRPGGIAAPSAALAALPGSMRSRATVDSAGGTVTVHVRIPAVLPGFAADVSASAAEVRS